MKGALRISDAASLALHTMVYIAGGDRRHYPVRVIARAICVSEAHLSKVLQRLVRAGLLVSVRGPRGGFRLARKRDEVTLLEVFEAIDGPYEPNDCLLRDRSCGQLGCLFGDLLRNVNGEVREYMAGRTLEDVKWVYATANDRERVYDEAQDHQH